MSRVIQPSRDELAELRKRLLERAGASDDTLAARARRHDLDGDEWWIWEQIRSIDFLLDDSAHERAGTT